MKTILRYYLGSIFRSLALWAWTAILLLDVLAPSLVHFGGIEGGPELLPLFRSQLVLYTCWAFILLQSGYWTIRFAGDRRASGLSVWWEAEGISGTRQFAGLVASCWMPTVAFLLCALLLLGLLSQFNRPVPLALLAEQAFTMILGAGLYCGLCAVLGTLLDRSLALALALGECLFAFHGLLLARAAVARFPEPLDSVLSVTLLFLPNFDLYFRPGAVIHLWPPLAGGILLGILAYTLVWGLLFLLAAKVAFKPCFA